jgi:hypothetical protein
VIESCNCPKVKCSRTICPVDCGNAQDKMNNNIKPKSEPFNSLSKPRILSNGGSCGRVRQANCNNLTKSVFVLTAGLLKMHQFHVHPCPSDMMELCTNLWLTATSKLEVEMEAVPGIITTVCHCDCLIKVVLTIY